MWKTRATSSGFPLSGDPVRELMRVGVLVEEEEGAEVVDVVVTVDVSGAAMNPTIGVTLRRPDTSGRRES